MFLGAEKIDEITQNKGRAIRCGYTSQDRVMYAGDVPSMLIATGNIDPYDLFEKVKQRPRKMSQKAQFPLATTARMFPTQRMNRGHCDRNPISIIK